MTNSNPKRSSPRGEDIPWKSQDSSAPRNTRDKRNEAAPQRLQDKSAPRRPTTRFTLPDLPRSQWCDIRTSYIERGLTLVELAEIYQCDYRTIKACLIRNPIHCGRHIFLPFNLIYSIEGSYYRGLAFQMNTTS